VQHDAHRRRWLPVLGISLLLAMVFACGVLLSSVQWMNAAPLPPAPRDPAACAALGGRWGQIGRLPQPGCNLPTADAGRLCFASAACSSDCLTELSFAGFGIGRCAAWSSNVGGCMSFIENGIEQQVCID
jgi:hypothetical protein